MFHAFYLIQLEMKHFYSIESPFIMRIYNCCLQWIRIKFINIENHSLRDGAKDSRTEVKNEYLQITSTEHGHSSRTPSTLHFIRKAYSKMMMVNKSKPLPCRMEKNVVA